MTYQPDLAFPEASERVQSFVDSAVGSGVRRLVLLSGRNEDGAVRAEQAVQASGVDWTVVRSSMFDQDFSEAHLLQPLLAGELAFPARDVREPFIDADDIADIVAAALSDDRHVGQLYEETGPRLLTLADAVAEIDHAAGRDIHYLPISAEDYAAGIVEAGVPGDEVAAYIELFAATLDGRNAYVAGVERALGRPAGDFADYARDTAASGVWSVGVSCLRRDIVDGYVTALTVITALGCGVSAGVFFAFSTFAMKAVGRVPPPGGIAAMHAINVAAVTPAFMAALLGTAVASVAVIVATRSDLDQPYAVVLIVGSGVSLVGTILPTIGCHVSCDEALAAVDRHGDLTAGRWARYRSGWTAWNHLRAAAALAAAPLLTVGVHVA